MRPLLAKAFKKISEELPEYEQDFLAERLIQLLETEDKQWDSLFDPASTEASQKFATLQKRARAHFEAGRTEVLDLKNSDLAHNTGLLGWHMASCRHR